MKERGLPRALPGVPGVQSGTIRNYCGEGSRAAGAFVSRTRSDTFSPLGERESARRIGSDLARFTAREIVTRFAPFAERTTYAANPNPLLSETII